MANSPIDNITKLQNLAFDPSTNSFNVNIVGGFTPSGTSYWTLDALDDILYNDSYTSLLLRANEDIYLNVAASYVSDVSYNDTTLVDKQYVDSRSVVSMVSDPIQLKAISKLGQTITTDVDGMVPIPEVIQASNGITTDASGHIAFNKSGFYRIEVQLNIDNTNNTNIDTWAEYWNGSIWADLPESGNVKDAGTTGIGNFIISTTLEVSDSLMIRLKVRTVSGSATLKYDIADGGIGVPSMTLIAYELSPIVAGLAVEPNNITEPFTIGKEASGNYASFNEDGEMRMYGNAVQWDDITNSLLASKLDGTQGTLQYVYEENAIEMGSGGDITDSRDRLIFNLQKMHKMLPEGEMRLHIHWEQTDAISREFTVQHRVQSNGDAKEENWVTTIIQTNDSNAFPYVSGTMNQITGLVNVDLSQFSISSTVQFRLARTDAVAGIILGTFVDAHIPINSLGSNDEYVKY